MGRTPLPGPVVLKPRPERSAADIRIARQGVSRFARRFLPPRHAGASQVWMRKRFRALSASRACESAGALRFAGNGRVCAGRAWMRKRFCASGPDIRIARQGVSRFARRFLPPRRAGASQVWMRERFRALSASRACESAGALRFAGNGRVCAGRRGTGALSVALCATANGFVLCMQRGKTRAANPEKAPENFRMPLDSAGRKWYS